MVVATSNDAVAEPIVTLWRWYGEQPRTVDGGHVRYCDWGLASATNPPQLDCVPNTLTNNDPPNFSGATTQQFPNPMGVGAADVDGDDITEFFGLTRSNPALSGLSVGGGDIDVEHGFANFEHRLPLFPQVSQGMGDIVTPVGFATAVDASGLFLDYFVAQTTNGSNFVVHTYRATLATAASPYLRGPGTDPAPVALAVPGMLVVGRESANSNFLGFTVTDDDGDGTVELAVLHTATTPGADQARISIFSQTGAFVRTITLNRDPIAGANVVTDNSLTLVTGFLRHSVLNGGDREWLVATLEHTPGHMSTGIPELALSFWRYQDGGPNDGALIAELPLPHNSVPSWNGAMMVGMAGLHKCTNCKNGTECQTDVDGDGINDIWETQGVDVDCDGDVITSEGDIALQNFANPRRKDLFLEMDWFPSEEPTRGVIQPMKDAFAAAPVNNLDGTTGISLWVDTGPLRDPQVREDGVGGWNSCNDGTDNGVAAGLPADGPDSGDGECPPVGDDIGGGNAVPLIANEFISGDFEVETKIRPTNQAAARQKIFRYMFMARPATRQASNFFGFLPADPVTGRPNVTDARLTEDGIPGACLNGIDESADGADISDSSFDCMDPVSGLFDATRAEDGKAAGTCGNTIDDGADGADTQDITGDCNTDPDGTEGGVVGGCINGIDDDMNGKIDAADPACFYYGGGQAHFDRSVVWLKEAWVIMHEFGHMLGLHHGGPGLGEPKDANDPDCLDAMGVFDGTRREDGVGIGSCANGIDDGGGDGSDVNDPDCMNNGGWTPFGIEDGLGLNTCSNGFDDDFGLNCKPNYISIMNYSYTGAALPIKAGIEDGSTTPGSCNDGFDNGALVGLPIDGFDGTDPDCIRGADVNGDGILDNVTLDYSPPRFPGGGRGQAPLAALTESALIEQFASVPPMDPTDNFHLFVANVADGSDALDTDCTPGGVYNPLLSEDRRAAGTCGNGKDDGFGDKRYWPLNGDSDGDGAVDLTGVDWNNDGFVTSVNTGADINAVGNCPENTGFSTQAMVGANDWANIVYATSGITAASIIPEPPYTAVLQAEADFREAFYSSDLAVSTSAGCAGLPGTIDATVHNLGPIAGNATMVDVILPLGATVGALPAGCSVRENGIVRCLAGLLGVGQSRTFSLALGGSLVGSGEIVLQAFHGAGPDLAPDDNEVVIPVVAPQKTVSVCHSDPQVIDLGGGPSCPGSLAKVGTRSINPPIAILDGALEVVPGRKYTVNYGSFQQVLTVQETEGVACCAAGQTVLEGTPTSNQIIPTAAANYCVLGLGGQDTITTPSGSDFLFGGNDGDAITSSGGNDLLFGGRGQDNLTSGSGVFEGHGGLDGDQITASSSSSAKLWGGTGSDNLTGGPGADQIFPGSGADLVSAGSGNDRVTLFDECEAVAGKVLRGGSGNDTLVTPVSLSTLTSAGVTVEGFEQVIMDASRAYLSDCFSPCASDRLTLLSATSSSNENSVKTALKAIDGDMSSRWSSGFSDPQWIYVDLGSAKLVTRVILNWENAYSKSYSLQVANSPAGPWFGVYSDSNANGGTDDIKNLRGYGRYLRMHSSQRATQFGNSLWELEVYGDTEIMCAGAVNLIPVAATSSSNESSSLGPDKAIDGSLSTRWSSSHSNSQWITLDLGGTRTIKSVRVDWEGAYSAKYDLMVSSSSSGPWTTFYTDNAANGGIDELSGFEVIGRYLRVNGRARATQYGHSLWEVRAYGAP